MKDGNSTVLYTKETRMVCTTCAILKRCARLASLALLVLVAHASRDPCMRDVWGAPRPEALRACEASDPAGHYTIPLLASVVSTLCHIPRRAPQLPTGKLRWLLDLQLPPNVSWKPPKQFPVFETKCRLPVPTARKQVHHAGA